MDETQLQQRIQELQQSGWRTVKAAANAVGILSIPEDAKWTEYAEEIAKRELANADTDPIPSSPAADVDEPMASVEQSPSIRGVYPTEFYRANNIPYCELCGEKYLSGGDGRAICPEDFRGQCPRFSGE